MNNIMVIDRDNINVSSGINKKTMYFKAYRMNGKKAVQHALDMMEGLDATNLLLEKDDVAEITVGRQGIYHVKGSWNHNRSSQSVNNNTRLSCFLGLIFNPGSAFGNVPVEISMLKLIERMDFVDFNDPVLDDFAVSMDEDSSVLVVLGDEATLDKYDKVFRGYNKDEFMLGLSPVLEKLLTIASQKIGFVS